MPVAFLLGPLNHLMSITELDQQPSKILDHTHMSTSMDLTRFHGHIWTLGLDPGFVGLLVDYRHRRVTRGGSGSF